MARKSRKQSEEDHDEMVDAQEEVDSVEAAEDDEEHQDDLEQADDDEEEEEYHDGTEDGVKVHASPFPGSRLMIKEMVLENFKSYAGVKRIGPFHKCFSSVVGPNGSGKSNVIDAMLFVFGKRAKKLRLSKVSELIHHSTAFPDCDYAKVTVYFQNIIDRDTNPEDDDDEGFDVVEGSQLEVSRVAYQSNKSDYYVDGKKKTFTQVAKLLQTRGIDLQNNRFLILQGEVEQISLMKPKAPNPHEDGLLEYLEDIIGSNKYVEDIEKGQEQVEELSERRMEKLNRVKVVEKEKEGLEDAKVEAEEYLEKDCKLAQKKNLLLQQKRYTIQKELVELSEKQAQIEAKIREEEETMNALKKEQEDSDGTLNAKKAEYQALVDNLNTKKEQFAAFERMDIEFREELKMLQATIKDSETLVTKQAKLKKKHEKAAEDAKDSIPKLEAEAESLKESRAAAEADLEKAYESLSGETAGLREELEAKQKDLAPLSATVSEAKSELDMTLTEIEILQNSSNQNKDEMNAAQDRLDNLEISIEARPGEIKVAEADLQRAETDLEVVVSQLTDAEKMEASLESRLKEKRGKTESAKASLASASRRGAMLQNLMQEKSSKGSSISRAGLCGRLGDLGTIDAEYDVAVSTACGGLDFLVTETTKGAEACVQYLRRKELGRATFAILEKLQHLRNKMDRDLKTPEDVPRLFDLIQVKDEKYRVAFYFAMRDTLVAKDLDQAVRIAYQGGKCVWRVVTLQGQVIDTSGTMSGGGNKVKRGSMRLSATNSSKHAQQQRGADDEDVLVSKEELKHMESETERLAEELTACRQNKMKLTKERKRLEQLIKDLHLMIPKMQMELDEMHKQKELLEKNIEALKPKCQVSTSDSAKLLELEKERDTKQKAYDKAYKKLSALEKETSKLHEEIAKIGGDKVQKMKDRIDHLSKDIETNRKALNKANNDVKSATNKVEKADAAAKEAEQEIEQSKQRIDELKAQFKTIEDDAMQVMQALDEAKIQVKEKEEELESMKTNTSQNGGKINKIQKVMIELRSQLTEYRDQDIPKKEKTLESVDAALTTLKQQYETIIEQINATGTIKTVAAKKTYSKENAMEVDETAETQPTLEQEDGKDEVEVQEKKEEADLEQEDEEQEDVEEDQQEEEEEEEEDDEEDAMVQTLPEFTEEQLENVDPNLVALEIEQLESDVKKLKRVVNMGAIKEYLEREKEYMAHVEELDKATAERDAAREACDTLRKKRLSEFMTGFSEITLKLKEMYQMITLGGDAELELVDSCDPFSEGIVFSVRPPKKSWKNISNLSGGEKTLSSLALVFALHHYKPTPLYVMDEIDAALDFKNVSVVGNYIKERTKNAQFIIISLRNNMFELADRLIGIYKTHDATKSITINPAKVVHKSMHANTKLHSTSEPAATKRKPLGTLNV